MGNIMTRAAVGKIMGDENLTAEQRTEQIMSLYGRALDEGYISKNAAASAQETAITNAKAEWEKGLAKPDPKESDEYKALAGEYASYKEMQTARASDEYKSVKPKFFETVYSKVDRKDGAKPISEQLEAIRKEYEEYFTADSGEQEKTEPKNTPQYSQGNKSPSFNPDSDEDKLYKQLAEQWK